MGQVLEEPDGFEGEESHANALSGKWVRSRISYNGRGFPISGDSLG